MLEEGATFVAREGQLQELDETLRQTLAGRASVCFVTGEAGVGKTALVREFGRRAEHDHGSLIRASGSCSAFSGDSDPYLPFREILGQLTGSPDAKVAEGALTSESAGRLAGILKKSTAAIVEFGPSLVEIFVPGAELAARLGRQAVRRTSGRRGTGEEVGRSEDATVGVDQSQIFEQYTNVLRRLASESPLLLALDDLHWVDTASANLLFHLARRLGDSPVLFVGTYRPQDVALGREGERHPLAPVIGELQRQMGEILIDLDAAADTEGRGLVDALLDAEPNLLGEDFRQALNARTDGHPLFTTELLRALQDRGDLVPDEHGRWTVTGSLDWNVLPARVEGVIGERIGRLPDLESRLLAVASVEGEEFTAEVVAAVENMPPRDVVRTLSSNVTKSHDVIRGRGVLRSDGQRLTRYGFRHSLFQRWLYDSLDASERGWLHEDVAHALEELHGERAGEISPQLARHYVEAGLLRKAAEFHLLAADQARAAYANEEAAKGYGEVLALLERLEREEGQDADGAWILEVRERTRESRGDVLSQIGEQEEARDEYRAVLDSLPDSARVGRGRILRKMAQGLMQQHRMGESVEMFEAAEAELGSVPAAGDTGWLEELLETRLALLWALYWCGSPEDVTRALELAEETRPSVERHANPRLQAILNSRLCMLRGRRERYMPSDETMELAGAALAAARDSNDRRTVLDIEFLLGFYRLWRREFDEAEPLLRSNLENATHVGSLFQRILALTYLAVLRRWLGKPDEVEDLARVCLVDAKHLGIDTYVGTAHANLAWIALRAGDHGGAREGSDIALDMWQKSGIAYPFKWLGLLPLLVLACEDGDAGQVAALSGRLLDPAQQRLPVEIEQPLERAREGSGDASLILDAGRQAVEAARSLGHL